MAETVEISRKYSLKDGDVEVILELVFMPKNETSTGVWRVDIDGTAVDLQTTIPKAKKVGEEVAAQVLRLKLAAKEMNNQFADVVKPRRDELEIQLGRIAKTPKKGDIAITDPDARKNQNLDKEIDAMIGAAAK